MVWCGGEREEKGEGSIARRGERNFGENNLLLRLDPAWGAGLGSLRPASGICGHLSTQWDHATWVLHASETPLNFSVAPEILHEQLRYGHSLVYVPRSFKTLRVHCLVGPPV